MRKLKNYISLMFLSALALGSCEQVYLEEAEEVQLPEHGYILFTSGLSTRASLQTDMKRNFSVMGYNWEYVNQNDIWTTIRAKAKPNVFYNQKITYNSSSNLHSYTNLKSWEGGKKYTFFGYYPPKDESANTIDSISLNTWEGTPYLTYILPSNPANMQDVMTANIYNTDYRTSREVGLSFKHRLTSVDVQMVNLNDRFDQNNTPDNKNDDVDVYLKITNMRIHFDNLRYNKVRLWMDETIADIPAAVNRWNPQASFDLFGSKLVEPSGSSTNTTIAATSGNPLIIIPQYVDAQNTEFLKGELTFNLQYTDATGNNVINITDAEVAAGSHTHEFNIGRDVLPGRKHTIQLTFTRDAVTVTIIPPGDWKDYNVPIEFL